MGLFRKDNPAEKKLKELTGGFILNSSFSELLKNNGIKTSDGIKIQRQLKDEIKNGEVDELTLELRLDQLINQHSKIRNHVTKKKCPKCNQAQDLDNTFCINCGYEFKNTVICPKCNSPQDSSNHFCMECGYDFVDKKLQSTKKECPNCHNIIDNKTMKCSDCGYDFESKQVKGIVKKCPICNLVQTGLNRDCINCRHDLSNVDYQPSDELIECEKCNRLMPKNNTICPFCNHDINAVEIEEIEDIKEEELVIELPENDQVRQVRFLNTFDFNLKTCPECDTKFLKSDPFCFNCGSSVLTQDTVRNDNLEVKDGKLVEKSQNESDDELSSLEALYNQTVQSKYAPGFKMAYVLYLEHFRKNPSKKFSDKTAKRYETTPNKLKKQAIEDEFVELASPLGAARDFKVSDLKEILKQYDLKVSGKKDELIGRLGENLSDDELKKHFKSKNYQISEKGLEFLDKNSYILYILSDKDISGAFYPAEIGKIFEEKHYSEDEIHEKLVSYLTGMLDKKLTQELWVDFKLYSNALAQVLEDKGELKQALNIRMKVFLFDVNNYSIVLNKPEPSKTKLKQKDMVKLTRLLHNLTLPVDELKELFDNAFNEVLFKTAITSQDSLIYLLKVFGGEDLNNVSAEINEKYSNPY